jgi:hypothetical protein
MANLKAKFKSSIKSKNGYDPEPPSKKGIGKGKGNIHLGIASAIAGGIGTIGALIAKRKKKKEAERKKMVEQDVEQEKMEKD